MDGSELLKSKKERLSVVVTLSADEAAEVAAKANFSPWDESIFPFPLSSTEVRIGFDSSRRLWESEL